MAEDAFIVTLKGGKTEAFSPRHVENKAPKFWKDFDANCVILCARVVTPGGAIEYRPLYQFVCLPPLDEIDLYTPTSTKYKYKRLKRDDPAVIEAIQEQLRSR